MSFVNEHISASDREKFQIEEINKKVGPIGFTNAEHWTIDRDREIYLRCVKQGREEASNRTIWTFFWRGKLLWVSLQMTKVTGVPGGPRTAYWKLTDIREGGDGSSDLSDELASGRHQILQDLLEALNAERGGGVYSSIKEYKAILDIESERG